MIFNLHAMQQNYVNNIFQAMWDNTTNNYALFGSNEEKLNIINTNLDDAKDDYFKNPIVKKYLLPGLLVSNMQNDNIKILVTHCVTKILEKNQSLVNEIVYNGRAGQDGLNPLAIAVTSNNAAMVKLLLDKGADVNAKTFDLLKRLPLVIALDTQNISSEIFQLLLNRQEIKIPDDSLDRAIRGKKNFEIIKQLVNKDKNLVKYINQFDDNNTPLHLVIKELNTAGKTSIQELQKTIIYLIGAGAIIEAKNSQQKTPLELLSSGLPPNQRKPKDFKDRRERLVDIYILKKTERQDNKGFDIMEPDLDGIETIRKVFQQQQTTTKTDHLKTSLESLQNQLKELNKNLVSLQTKLSNLRTALQ